MGAKLIPSPGPWKIQAHQRSHGAHTVIVDANDCVIATLRHKAWMGRASPSTAARDVADTRLLQAAPVLATLLAEALEYARNATLEDDDLPPFVTQGEQVLKYVNADKITMGGMPK